jgi:hypothetical protein
MYGHMQVFLIRGFEEPDEPHRSGKSREGTEATAVSFAFELPPSFP